MNPPSDSHDKKDQNRLSQHLHILGLEKHEDLLDEGLAAERQLMDSMDLPDLKLPDKKRSASPFSMARKYQVPVLIAMAAAVTLMVFKWQRPSDDTPYRFKGGSQVVVYYNLDGKTREFQPGQTLINGTKVRAELIAQEDVVGFMAVVDGEGRLLSPTKEVAGSFLELKANQRMFFEGSIELVGENEGETLRVMTCPLAQESMARTGVIEFISGNLPLPDDCRLKNIKLR